MVEAIIGAVLLFICAVAILGKFLWSNFRRSNKKPDFQIKDELCETDIFKQYVLEPQIQQFQEKNYDKQKTYTKSKDINKVNKNKIKLDDGFKYLVSLENGIELADIGIKTKSSFQIEFEKLLNIKKIIDKQLDNVDQLIIDNTKNKDHKNLDMFSIYDIKANIDKYNITLNKIIKKIKNNKINFDNDDIKPEEVQLALEGKYRPYVNVYDYISNNIQQIIDATKIENKEEQNKIIKRIINQSKIQTDITNKIIDGENNYISLLEEDNNTMKETVLWIDRKVDGIVNLGNRIIKSNNNDIFPSPYNGGEENNKNNEPSNVSKFDLDNELEELNKYKFS